MIQVMLSDLMTLLHPLEAKRDSHNPYQQQKYHVLVLKDKESNQNIDHMTK